jgi:hypothetical protein
MKTAFALGSVGPDGRVWFLKRDAFAGNLMRTPDPGSAHTWAREADLMTWFERIPAYAKAQFLDKPLAAYPIAVSVGEPARVFSVESEPSPDDPEAVVYRASLGDP